MKPLIISFFAVLLCYSMFVDDDKAKSVVKKSVNVLHSNTSDTIRKADTTVFYAKKYPLQAVDKYNTDFKY